MEEKICNKCGIKKDINNFRMKKTKNVYMRYGICKECETKAHKKYFDKNKDKINQKRREWALKNKEHLKKYNLKWEEENKEHRNKYHENYRKNHVEERRIIDNICKSRKKREDKTYKLKCQVRTMIATCFKRKKFTKTLINQKILGCDYETFINHLLQTFKDNYGYEWDGIEKVHIDHKKPLKLATTEEEVIKLCYYTNLQLLKAKDNLEKSDKLNWKMEENNE